MSEYPEKPAEQPRPYIVIHIGEVTITCGKFPARFITALFMLGTSFSTWWFTTH